MNSQSSFYNYGFYFSRTSALVALRFLIQSGDEAVECLPKSGLSYYGLNIWIHNLQRDLNISQCYWYLQRLVCFTNFKPPVACSFRFSLNTSAVTYWLDIFCCTSFQVTDLYQKVLQRKRENYCARYSLSYLWLKNPEGLILLITIWLQHEFHPPGVDRRSEATAVAGWGWLRIYSYLPNFVTSSGRGLGI